MVSVPQPTSTARPPGSRHGEGTWQTAPSPKDPDLGRISGTLHCNLRPNLSRALTSVVMCVGVSLIRSSGP